MHPITRLCAAFILSSGLLACSSTPTPAPDAAPEAAQPASKPASAPTTAKPDKGSKAFWDGVYNRQEYVYGIEPNVFFAEQLAKLPVGTVLLPAEGEGRNAVWAAKAGWSVEAFDISPVAKDKAMKLAADKGVAITYNVADFADPKLGEERFDAIGLVYAHMPPKVRDAGMKHLAAALKPGGVIILEGFSPAHIELKTPFGPKSTEVLYTQELLKAALPGFEMLILEDAQIELDEGYHQGKAAVIRMVARKPQANP